jgi:hypothetical protein
LIFAENGKINSQKCAIFFEAHGPILAAASDEGMLALVVERDFSLIFM